MRKAHSPYGNAGSNTKNDTESLLRQRCNLCNFCNGIDGRRQMFKDPEDITGGFLCKVCKNDRGYVLPSEKNEEWYREAVDASRRTVDGERQYDEMIEDLVTTWEKEQGG